MEEKAKISQEIGKNGGCPEFLVVVLVGARNPLNIGAVARAMSNFGCFDLRLVTPYPPAFQEAVSAVGAAAVLNNARVFPDVASAVADRSLVVAATGLDRRQPTHPVHRLEHAARLIRRRRVPTALLFGSEKTGLGNAALSHCHWLLHIPTRAAHESMNLAQAVAVCLWELNRSPQAARRATAARPPASVAELERLTALLEEILQSSGHTDYTRLCNAEEKTRRLIRRLAPGARDAATLTGMLRQVLWKLTHQS